MGNPRTPLPLRILRGNPSKRPLHNEPMPAIASQVPEPPRWLPPHAAAEWRRVAGPLHACGLLTHADIQTLAAYCCAYARWRLAEETLERQAKRDPANAALTVCDARGTLRQNPLVRVARAAADQMVSFAGALGATPIARTRLTAGIGGQDHSDGKFEGLLRG
jgi:P27 family predicted phage terminase small subunit